MRTGRQSPAGKYVNPFSLAVRSVRHAFVAVGLFSLAINLLMLTGPLFMLQVYDRVMTSRSVPTLVALFGLVVGLYAFLGLFDFVRKRILSRVSYGLDAQLARPSLNAWIKGRLSGASDIGRPVGDLTIVRGFVGSQALPAVFDLPWSPIYLAIIFLLHAYLGVLTLVGIGLVVMLALANELVTRESVREAMAAENRENDFAEHSLRNSEAIVSLGMVGNVARHWESLREAGKHWSQTAGDRSEGLTSFSKALRLVIQSAILGLGGYLAIKGEISAGSIVAGSILTGRALAPIDQTIGNWRNILRARQAYWRLSETLGRFGDARPSMVLPVPKGQLEVRGATKLVLDPSSGDGRGRRPILHGLNFKLRPGDVLGVIGPSASGKSTLARLLVGTTMPDQGTVRLDGATLDQWDRDRLGHHIGYLPQKVELLPGSLKQNISRFDADASDEEVIAAARLAGAHDLIVRLPQGYDTQIGSGAPPLSGGQAQRIALARALFRMPKLVVLDEPSSNLDVDGDAALAHAVAAMRGAASTVVVMTHRPSTIMTANLIMILREGRQVDFGERDAILRKVARPAAAPTPADRSTGERRVRGAAVAETSV
jgi:ATP-binding cassette, subfamily C, type I secretion system permease/ATPase